MRPEWLLTCFAVIICAVFAAEETTKPRKPCTVKSPTTGLDFDLSGLSVLPKTEGSKNKDAKVESWMARGYDSGVNYTINICAPVVEDIKDVDGVERSKWQNVSAFYMSEGKTISLGMQHSQPIFRGRKLVLHYENGSPCGGSIAGSKVADNDSTHIRRKSMMISFLCADTDSSEPKVALSFVGASPDFCHYGFEAKSSLACGGTITPTEQAVGPGSLFGIILLIALAVYIFGGVAYQRNVMHQRGWRQIPNYSMWSGVASFCKDIFIILFSSCTRFLPRRLGYNQLPAHNSRSRGNSRDDENRLIDQLDEEWED